MDQYESRLKDPGLPEPSVSVIIPTWNCADTLPKAIESVLSQSLPVLEVLVCDDRSTDGTAEVVMAMARHDPCIRNAHRIYSCAQVRGMFSSLRLVSFALITDTGEFQSNASEAMADSQSYGCGCFEFTK